MNVVGLIVNIAVAAGTLALAVAAFKNIRETKKIRQEDKKNRIIGKSPILKFELQTVDGRLAAYTDNEIRIECRNVGYGPAFNVTISCRQGSSPVKLEHSKQFFPLSLQVGDKITLECLWPFDLLSQEDNDKPLAIESVAESMFQTKVRQKFKLPISTEGSYAAVTLESINFGV